MKELEDATGVGREAIRFYIREGMLPEPERPHRNVAYYGHEHVIRIRAIKRLQEETYLPLARIRALLENADVQALAEGRGEQIAALLPEMLGGAGGEGGFTPAEVAARSGIEHGELAEMIARGYLVPDAAGRLDGRDLDVCTAWARIRAAGFTAEDGFDLDHLERCLRSVTELAREEVRLFLAGVGARGSGEEAARRGAEGLLLGNELLAALRISAAFAALRTGEGPGPPSP